MKKKQLLSREETIRIQNLVKVLDKPIQKNTRDKLKNLEAITRSTNSTIKDSPEPHVHSNMKVHELREHKTKAVKNSATEIHQGQLWGIFMASQLIKELIEFQRTLKIPEDHKPHTKHEEEEEEGETDYNNLALARQFMLANIIEHYPCIKALTDNYPQTTAFLQKKLNGLDLKNAVETPPEKITKEHVIQRIQDLIGNDFFIKDKSKLVELEFYAKKYEGMVYDALRKTSYGKKMGKNTAKISERAQTMEKLNLEKMRFIHPNLAICFMRTLKIVFNEDNEQIFKRNQLSCDLHYLQQALKETPEKAITMIGKGASWHITPRGANILYILDHYTQKYGGLVERELKNNYFTNLIRGIKTSRRNCINQEWITINKTHYIKSSRILLRILKYSCKNELNDFASYLCIILAKKKPLLIEIIQQHMMEGHSIQNRLTFIQQLKGLLVPSLKSQKTTPFILRAILIIEEYEKNLVYSQSTNKNELLFRAEHCNSTFVHTLPIKIFQENKVNPRNFIGGMEVYDSSKLKLSFWEALALSSGCYLGVKYEEWAKKYDNSNIRNLLLFDETQDWTTKEISDLMLVPNDMFAELSSKNMKQHIAYISIEENNLHIKLLTKQKISVLFGFKITEKLINDYKKVANLQIIEQLKENILLSLQNKEKLESTLRGVKCSQNHSPWLLAMYLYGVNNFTGDFRKNINKNLYSNKFTIMVTELNFAFYMAAVKNAVQKLSAGEKYNTLQQLTSYITLSEIPSLQLGKHKKQLLQIFIGAVRRKDWQICENILKTNFSTIHYTKQEESCEKIIEKVESIQELRRHEKQEQSMNESLQKMKEELYKDEEDGEELEDLNKNPVIM